MTYWENPQGVRINYFYVTDIFKKIRLIAIKYGSTYDNLPINEVSFIYKNRLNPETQYISGLSITDDKILSEIKVFGNGYGFSNYIFTYDISSLGYERLTRITQKSGDGIKEINPTVFTYIKNQTTYNPAIETLNTIPTFESYTLNSYPPTVGDFDGDGELDFLVSSNEGLKINKILDDNSLVNIANQNTILLTSPSNAVTVTSLDSNFRISNKQNLCTYDHIPNSTEVNFKVFKFDSNTIELDYQRTVKYKDNLSSAYGLGIFSGDFNGDKLTDFVFLHSEQEGGNNKIKFLNLDRRLTSNFSSDAGIIDIGTSTFILTPNVSNGLATITGKSIMKAGDINGDGKTDLILFRGSPYNDIQVYSLINGNFETIFNWNYNLPGDIGSDFFQSHSVYNTTVLGTGKQQYPIVIGDYNGDGKSDIFFAATGKILISTGRTFIEEIVSNSYSAIDSQKEVFLALDYNNDGKSDILRIKPNVKQFTDGTTRTVWYDSSGQIQVCCPVQHYRYEYGINMQFYFKSNSWLSYNFEQNSGYDFSKTFLPLFTKKNKINALKTDLIILGGQSNTSSSNLRYTTSFLSNNNILSNQNLIKSITTGNGVKETITYSSLINGNGVYTASGPIENYPNIDIVNASGFQLVSKIEKQSSSVYKKQLFAYYGAVSNTEGLGFLGFRSTVRTNWHDDSNAIISSISKFDIEQRGANVENYTVLGWHDPLTSTGKQKPTKIVKEGTYTITGSENLVATQSIVLKPNTWIQAGSTFTAKIDPNGNVSPNTPTDYITKSIQTYESELLSNKVFKIKNVLSKQHNKLENTNSETTTTYDTYNNPKQITTLLKEGTSVVQTTVTTLGYDNQPSGTTYYIGRPTSKTKSVTASGDSTTSDEIYEYTNNLLTKVKKNSNNSSYIVEDNQYDTFGNITKKTISVPAVGTNPAPAPRVTNYEYNPAFPYNGRFLTKSKDINLLETQYNFNPNNGVLNSETNPYGLTTSYTYDPWFKKKTTTDYLGKKNTYTYTRSGSINVVSSAGDDGSNSLEVYDDLGRKTQTTVKDISGNNSNISYEYDIYDREVKVFEPNNLNQWSETKYDEYGRVKENISYTGKIVTMSYPSGTLTSIVNDGSKTKTYTKNAMGNVVSMIDALGGKIDYTYFANGNLKTTNYDGVVTTLEQDAWGRKTKLTDPSAGEYRYTYNGFGETTSEITPNGTTTYNLDDFGKLATKTIIGGNHTNSKTTYNYDSTSKLLNSSIFEDLLNGTTTTTTHSYDTSKRLYKTVEATPSYATFTKQVTFDSFGRVEKETSTASSNGNSSAKTIKNTYKNGYPWQILSDDVIPKVLWQTNTVNARGQLLTAQLGNGIAITNAYDEFGYITQFKHDKTGANPANIMTLNTTFDPIKGNLKTRNDISLFGWSEDFTNSYDNQDRLTSYKKNAQGDIDTQSYDDKGRITKNGVGTYSYLNNGKAYQNTAVTFDPLIPLNTESKVYYTNRGNLPDPNTKRQLNIKYNVLGISV